MDEMMFTQGILEKGFHKTSLSLLDLCFKVLPSRFLVLRPSRGKMEELPKWEEVVKAFRLNLSVVLM